MPIWLKVVAGYLIMEPNIYEQIDPDVYRQRGQANEIESYQFQHWRPRILDAIAKYAKNAVVLDLGCGPGADCFEMKKYAAKVYGVDSSQKMIEYAKATYPGIDFIHADAAATTLQTGSIDTVLSIGLFEYAADKQRVMQEISRVVKPGGMAVILAPNKYSMPRGFYALACAVIGKKRVCSEPSFGQMLRMFKAAGFLLVESAMDDGLFFLPRPFEKLLGRRTWLVIEKCFKPFGRNPLSMNMLFIIKKNV